jgi:hypothetical protein
VAFGLLMVMEMYGYAIAYRDFDGALAWKASESFCGGALPRGNRWGSYE